MVNDFHEFGAKHPEVGAFRNLLNHLGIVAPHSGRPFTEELLFGIGGGIGFGYFLFEQHGSHPVMIGTRIHTKETERPEFLQTIASRMGVPVHVQHSSSAHAASSNLRSNFEQSRNPIVWLDEARLPYMGLESTMHTYHAAVACGMDADGNVRLSDRCPEPVALSTEEFRVARESSWSPKYRAMIVQKTENLSDIRAAVEGGIRDSVRQMNEGLGITNFGLKGMDKWADVLTSTREKKSWLKIFPPGPALFDSLFSIFCQIRLRGATGSAHRALYADFLDEAAGVLNRPQLREVAEQFRHSEQMWTELADAHLPAAVPQFSEIRRLAVERKELFEKQGGSAIGEINQHKERIGQLAAEMRQEFPLNAADTKSLLNDLRVRILRLKEHEAECVRILESYLDPKAADGPVAERTAEDEHVRTHAYTH